MKMATIYEREGWLYIHSSSQTTAGLWIMSAPFQSIKKEHFAEVGRAIRECLAASQQGVPHPKSFTNLFAPMLELAGVKSFATFVRSTKCVTVEAVVDEIVTLTPTRNEGAKGGFAPLANKLQASCNSDESLGSAAVATLARSE